MSNLKLNFFLIQITFLTVGFLKCEPIPELPNCKVKMEKCKNLWQIGSKKILCEGCGIGCPCEIDDVDPPDKSRPLANCSLSIEEKHCTEKCSYFIPGEFVCYTGPNKTQPCVMRDKLGPLPPLSTQKPFLPEQNSPLPCISSINTQTCTKIEVYKEPNQYICYLCPNGCPCVYDSTKVSITTSTTKKQTETKEEKPLSWSILATGLVFLVILIASIVIAFVSIFCCYRSGKCCFKNRKYSQKLSTQTSSENANNPNSSVQVSVIESDEAPKEDTNPRANSSVINTPLEDPSLAMIYYDFDRQSTFSTDPPSYSSNSLNSQTVDKLPPYNSVFHFFNRNL